MSQLCYFPSSSSSSPSSFASPMLTMQPHLTVPVSAAISLLIIGVGFSASSWRLDRAKNANPMSMV
ncbi:hypothetical protein J3E68DRAFT_397523 [Trichoderma sp. SZMC 28012]